MTSPVSPSRDDTGTTRFGRRCAGCGDTFVPTGRQLHCSSACRKRVFRTRHRLLGTPAAIPVGVGRRDHTIYECPECGQRRHGVQRCEECGIFGRAAGLGGDCPHCGEPVTAEDLGLDGGASR